jgi:hypothetical protein
VAEDNDYNLPLTRSATARRLNCIATDDERLGAGRAGMLPITPI